MSMTKNTGKRTLMRLLTPVGLAVGVFLGTVAGLAPQEANAWICWTNCSPPSSCNNRACLNTLSCPTTYKENKKCAFETDPETKVEACKTRNC